MSNDYDFIFAGGGAAALSLALELSQSSLKDRSILIIDPSDKKVNDRTWCFWDSKDQISPVLIHRTWRNLQINGVGWSNLFELGEYNYAMVRGIDFYEYARSQLSKKPNFHFRQTSVTQIRDHGDSVEVATEDAAYRGAYCFDSRYIFSADQKKDPGSYHDLIQHFRGWEIEANQIAFNPRTVTLFDFRTPQNGSMRFFYVLPLAEKKALIEYTIFSESILSSEEYDRALKTYIETILNIRDYHLTGIENGRIPMTDRPAVLNASPRHIYIGTRSGRVKPSSGYAFLRIHQDSKAIVRGLIDFNDPMVYRTKSSTAYQWFDRIMLHVMKYRGNEMASLFTQLFRNNPPARIFRFLDEETGIIEILKVLTSLRPWPFLQAFLQTILFNKN